MRKIMAAAVLVAALGGASASAGPVCINNGCSAVPGVYGSLNVSQTGQVKASGGVTGGPGLRTTGVDQVIVKQDNISFTPTVDGTSQGRTGIIIDYGDEVIYFYLADFGCRQIGDDRLLGPCHNDPNQ